MTTATFDPREYDHSYANTEAAETFEMPPDGKYNVALTKAAFGRVGEKLSPAIMWNARIIDGDFAGRTVMWNSYLSDAAMPFVKRSIEACGVRINRLSELTNYF